MAKGDREQIVVTEIPYQVNKATMLQKMAELVREKRLEGISDLRDESSREGMRVVIELKRDANASVVLNQLYKNTQLQESFGVINLSIVGGQPKVLSLAEMLRVFLDHRRDVVTRRTRFELRAAESQREVVLGLGMATTDIDRVIQTIRESPDVDTARERLMALPLHGLEEFVRRAGRPEEEIARRRRSSRSIGSPSGRPRPSSTCASRGSRASSARSSRWSTASCPTPSRGCSRSSATSGC